MTEEVETYNVPLTDQAAGRIYGLATPPIGQSMIWGAYSQSSLEKRIGELEQGIRAALCALEESSYSGDRLGKKILQTIPGFAPTTVEK